MASKFRGQREKRNQKWAIDYDYIDKLSPDQREYLKKFTDEHYSGAVKKDDPEALHNTQALRRDAYSRNNRANRDLLSIVGATGMLEPLTENLTAGGGEETVISSLDRERELVRAWKRLGDLQRLIGEQLARLKGVK